MNHLTKAIKLSRQEIRSEALVNSVTNLTYTKQEKIKTFMLGYSSTLFVIICVTREKGHETDMCESN